MSDTPASGAPSATPELADGDFRLLRDLIYANFGIHLPPEKKALVAGRLQSALRQRGGIGFGEYYRLVADDPTGRELGELVNRISTNHTFFNREGEHFDFFRDHALPEARHRALRAGTRDLRVWCAAASTGEEPYMLAMLMREAFGPEYGLWDLGLLATDISARALDAAKAGVYAAGRVAGLPAPLLRKYFRARPDGAYEAQPALKSDILFRRLNLVGPRLPFKRPFDVIFCRNVMIYFDAPTKEELVRRLCDATVPGGYLFIGHAESLGRQAGAYRYVRPAVYRKEPAP